jgi:mRNA interferase HigB
MKIVARNILEDFKRRHSDVRCSVDAWVAEVIAANWQTPADVKRRYASASFLAGNEVIFNLKGNRYRLKVQVSYRSQIVMILRAGTHSEYLKW